MLRRLLPPPKKSFLLCGPRGTGKSTWLAEHFGGAAVRLDLLSSAHYLRLLSNPSDIRAMVDHLRPSSWVIIDEIQRVPALMAEVHALYFVEELNAGRLF